MPEGFIEQNKDAGEKSPESPTMAELRRQIEEHQRHDSAQSYLKRAFGSIYGDDEESLKELTELYRQADEKRKAGDAAGLAQIERQVEERIRADRQAVSWQDEVNHYGAGFLKVTGLFMRGKVGLAGTLAIYALDQMNPGDSYKTQLADAALGATKGGLLKGAFHFVGDKPVSIAAKGVGLGVTSRVLELGLTRQTYLEAGTGEVQLGRGLSDVVRASLNPTALAADVVIFGAAHGLLGKANSLSGGAIEKSPLLTTMFTGTTFGLSAGATGEILRQHSAGESLDIGKIVRRSLIQGTLDTFAAAPGSIQADRGFRGQMGNYMRSGAERMRARVEEVQGAAGEFVDRAGMLLTGGGLEPAYAGMPGRLRPADFLSSRPGSRGARDNILMMSDNSQSGANLDGILGGSPRSEPGRVKAETRLEPEPRPVEDSSAGKLVSEVQAQAEGKAEPVAAPEGGILGGKKVAPTEVVLVRSEAELVSFREFEAAALRAAQPAAGQAERLSLFDFFRRHPELEIPIRKYESELFETLTRPHKPGEFTPQELVEMKNKVQLINEFYKPERPRIFVDSQQEFQAFAAMREWMKGLHRTETHVLYRNGLFELLNANPWFHPVARRYGATSNNPTEVAVLDMYFGTKNLVALKELMEWRQNPERFAAAKPAVAPEQPAEMQPRLSPEPPAEAQAKAPPEAKTVSEPEPPLATEKQEAPVASEPARAETGGETAADAAGLSALARVRPLKAGEAVAGLPKQEAAPPGEATAEPVRRDSKDAGPLAAPPPEWAQSPPFMPNETVPASVEAKGLYGGPVEKGQTARKLQDDVHKLSDADFQQWKDVVADGMLMGYLLKGPEVSALPTPVLKRFLGKIDPPAELPAWVRPHLERLEQQAIERAREQGREYRLPRSNYRDSFQARLELLQKTFEKFKDSPQTAQRLIELTAADKPALDAILFATGNPKFGEAYRNLIKTTVAEIESVEPLKHLLRFIRERDEEGAFAALQMMRPRASDRTVEAVEKALAAEEAARPRKTLEEIESEIQAEKEQIDGEYDPVEVSQLAQQAFAAQQPLSDPAALRARAESIIQAEQQKNLESWYKLQKQVHDLMTGNVPQPRGGFAGRGPGGPRGGPRGPRNDGRQ